MYPPCALCKLLSYKTCSLTDSSYNVHHATVEGLLFGDTRDSLDVEKELCPKCTVDTNIAHLAQDVRAQLGVQGRWDKFLQRLDLDGLIGALLE